MLQGFTKTTLAICYRHQPYDSSIHGIGHNDAPSAIAIAAWLFAHNTGIAIRCKALLISQLKQNTISIYIASLYLAVVNMH